jgi:hypothetical protein
LRIGQKDDTIQREMVTQTGMIDPTRDRLLLACARGRWDRQALEEARQIVHENEVDWDDFWAQASSHSVAPLIYHTLRDDDTILPAWVREKLRGAYYQSAVYNVLLYQALGEIMQAFNEARIPLVLLKGVALAKEVYGNIALRPMSDLDILVRQQYMCRAEELLVEQGYEVHTQAEPHLRHATFSKVGNRSGALIELHWHIISSPYYRRAIPEEWLWEDAVEVTMGDARALRLSPEAAIFHACLHMLDHIGIKDSLLFWLCDIVEISRHHSIDWAMLTDTAAQFKIALPVRSVLQESGELLNLPIPDHVLTRMLTLRTGFVERKAYQLCLSPTRSSASKAFFDFLAGEGLATKFRLLFSRLFPSRDYMIARYSIGNPRLVPLYYPYMVARAVLSSLSALARSQRG